MDLGKDNCKTRRETFMFWDSVRLILENWRYFYIGMLMLADAHMGQWTVWCQAIIWTNDDLLSIGSLEQTSVKIKI